MKAIRGGERGDLFAALTVWEWLLIDHTIYIMKCQLSVDWAKGLTGKHPCGTMEAPYEGKGQPLGRAAPNAVWFCDRSDTVRPAQGRGSTGKM